MQQMYIYYHFSLLSSTHPFYNSKKEKPLSHLSYILIFIIMEDTIVLYASHIHLNSVLLLAKFIADHHPSISVIILSTAAPNAATAAVSALPSVTYLRLAAAALPPDFTKNPVELLFEIVRLHNPSLRETLQQISQKSRIIAFVIDYFCGHAVEVSRSFDLPTYFYVSSGAFTLCAFLYFPTIDEKFQKDLGNLNDFVQVPGCSPIFSSDFPTGMFFRESKTYEYFLHCSVEMRKSAGILTNSFDALEFKAKESLSYDLCTPGGKTPPVYFIGPLINLKNNTNDVIEHECLNWLDLQPSKSVIYLCFGRNGFFSKEQLMEMAIGLENSGHRFLWAVRNPPGKFGLAQEDPDLDALLPEGFLERTKDRGFVLNSFAPQKEILAHDSVGGFVTHCGRSSMLEALSFGVPMIGWPLYAEQKINRTFMVEEMGVALPLEAEKDGFVTAAELEKRVKELLESEKGKEVRERIGELKNAAEAAVGIGGSSVVELERFVAEPVRNKE